MNQPSKRLLLGSFWRYLLLLFIVVGSLALMLSQPPFGQDPKYHDFADRRVFFGIPNSSDVTSNFVFLFVGIAGVRFCLRSGFGALRPAWLALFTGVALVSVGSAYYHWNPNSETLVWDRFLLVALACYIVAKASEAHDREIFIFTHGLCSGHALKHLLAGLGCFTILRMLKTRKLLHRDPSTFHAHVKEPPQPGYARLLGL